MFKEAKWEEALANTPRPELEGHMRDLDVIIDHVLCDDNTQEALKFMCNTIQQLAWTRMRRKLLSGIQIWYKGKIANILAGKALLAVAEAKRNGTIEEAEFEEVEDEMVKQFEATIEAAVSEGMPPLPIDTTTESTAEEAIAQAMAEESDLATGGCSC